MSNFPHGAGVLGVGVDIEKNKRILDLIDKWGEPFLNRVFTEREIKYCLHKKDGGGSFTARFSAKEALFKALGSGLRDGFKWTDVETLNDEKGKPYLKLYNKVKDAVGENTAHISLSHTREESMAFVILTR